MTNPDITKLAAAHAAATPGPWGHSETDIGNICGWVEPDEYRPIIHCSGTVDDWINNSHFIVLAHEHLPALLAELERLREALEKMQRSRDRYREAWEAEKAHGTARVAAALSSIKDQADAG